ncbi:MAG: single-stranded DNA-binding protein [Phycisphaerales bacterium]
MAGSFNQVILLGNLTRDIELKYTPSQTAVATFGIATNRSWTSPTGEKKEEVTFVDCEAWGKQAEVMKQYLTKGRAVFVQGRLKLDTWKDKNDGSNRSKLKVVVEEFRFVDGPRSGQSGPGPSAGDESGAPQVQTRSTRPSAPAAAHMDAAPEMDEKDIPF